MNSHVDFRNFFKKGLQNFSDSTSLHGYHQLYYAKTKVWRYIWLVVVCGAMAVTGYQIYRAVLTYMEQSSVTFIQPVDSGGLEYPPLDVCYLHWMSWVDWKKVISLNLTKETALSAFSYLKPICSSSIFEVEEARKKLIETMALNNISTLSELFKAIARPIPMVLAILGGGYLDEHPPFFHNITFRKTNDEIYLCYSLSGDDILGILKEKQSQISDEGVRSDSTTLNFSLQDPTYSMYSSYIDYQEYNYIIGKWLSLKTNFWLPTLSDFKKNYTAFTFPVRIFPDANANKYVEVTTENDEYHIEMIPTAHRQMNTKKNPCVFGKKGVSTEHSCQDICLATLQKKLNKCLTIEFATLIGEDTPEKMCPNNITFLSDLFNQTNNHHNQTDNYHNQTDNHRNQTQAKPGFTSTDSSKVVPEKDADQLRTEFQACVDACDVPCEIWKYTYTQYITTLASEARILSFKNQTDITIIYPDESDILIMIDADTRTWEDFIGNVGGLLGIWTGASLISFLEMFYLFCCKDMTCDCFGRKFIYQDKNQKEKGRVYREKSQKEKGTVFKEKTQEQNITV